MGPQQKEMQQAFPRTTQVGVGPNKEDFETKDNGQRKLGLSTEKLAEVGLKQANHTKY